MTRRAIVTSACLFLCLGMGAGVLVQHRQLDGLRMEQQRQSAAPLSQPAATSEAPDSVTAPAGPSPELSELLRLRSEVGQLVERKRALAGVHAENEQLRTRLASRSTNSAPGTALPPGYIRRTEAQWVGLSSPENTLQSFLWAMQNRDVTNFLQVLTPETAAKILKERSGSPEKIFEGMLGIPGMRLVSQETQPDGSIKAKFEILPGQSMGEDTIRFRQVGSEWKMDMR